ncbi:NADH dehydrogenase [ubiquinone] 1 alpha subcomplex assembly factor 8 [Agrilus planipennis]|uniref:NADH dehydrogenase [ubiquinone] 1 alpha subcomplex assembly factor 8 n=1 Tax=Agrilus planipennis TaxID=224129 RepID=A0A1W4WJV2_AGRPL|nr:NADH dehydrogenase [ubiquinone] 1 alpha subcomplex assembly factor 8 [Agrilus planipennis]
MMESVKKAKSRFRKYPALLAACKSEASVYAKCVVNKDLIKVNNCAEEFNLFKKCLQKSAASMGTRI